MRRIVYAHPSGVVCVVTPIVSADDPAGFTEQDALERALGKDVPAGAVVTILDESAFPVDRRKRMAWRLVGGAIIVDEAAWTQYRDQLAAQSIDAMDRLQFEHLFDLENRTRILELKTPITRAQYRQALIDRWKTLNP